MADPRVFVRFDLVNWTEITEYVKEIDIARGRSYEFDRFEPGTLSLTLDNADGRFTPGRSGLVNLTGNPARTNLETNPNFESGATTGWDFNSFFGTYNHTTQIVAPTDTKPWSRTYSLKATLASDAVKRQWVGKDFTGLTIGVAYTFSMYVWIPDTVADVRLEVAFGSTSADMVVKNSWQRVSVTHVATATNHLVGLGIAANTSAVPIYIDAVMVETGSTLYPYFDGSFDGCSWTGTANASASTKPAGETYYPHVKPKRQIKVVETIGAVEYPLFYGHVERWPVTVENGTSTVNVTATDIFGSLARTRLKRPLAEYLLNFSPQHYYPLSEGYESGSAQDWGSAAKDITPVFRYDATAEFGSTPVTTFGEGAISGKSWEITQTMGAGDDGVCLRLEPDEPDWGIESQRAFMYEITSATNSAAGYLDGPIYTETDDNGRVILDVRLYADAVPTKQVRARLFNNVGTPTSVTASVSITGTNFQVGEKFFIEVTTKADRTITLRVTRALESATTGVVSTNLYTNTSTALAIGYTPFPRRYADLGNGILADTSTAAKPYFKGKFSNLFIRYGTAAAITYDVGPHDQMFRIGFAGSSLTEFSMLILVVGWAGFSCEAPDGSLDSVKHLNWDDEEFSALELVKVIAEGVGAEIYPTAEGVVRLVNHRALLNIPVSITFDNSGATAVESGISFEVDDERIFNEASVTWYDNETVTRKIDAASVGEYGRKTLEILDKAYSNIHPVGYAEWLVYRGKDALVRVEGVRVDKTTLPSLQAALAALDWGQKIRLSNLPTQAPATQLDYIVEGFTRRISIDGGTTEDFINLNLSPADKTDGWILEDATYGELTSGPGVLIW